MSNSPIEAKNPIPTGATILPTPATATDSTTGPGVPPLFGLQKSSDSSWQYITGTTYTLNPTDIIAGLSLIICVDTLNIDADTTISLPGLNMVIITRILSFNNTSSANYNLTLDVSGTTPSPVVPDFPLNAANGVNPGDPGSDGNTGITIPVSENGGNGGSIVLIAGSTVNQLSASNLYVNVVGGTGQIGCDGQGGGNGATGANGANDIFGIDCTLLPGGAGGSGGNAGNGGNAANGGNGGNSGTFYFLLPEYIPSLVNLIINGYNQEMDVSGNISGGLAGNGGNGGSAGQPGAGGSGGEIGYSEEGVDNSGATVCTQYLTNTFYPNGSSGNAGISGTNGSIGSPGNAGTYYFYGITAAAFNVLSPLPNFEVVGPYLLSSMQLQMQLSFADYLTGDVDDAIAYYNWVSSTNNPWQFLNSDDEIYTEFQALQQQANALIAQLGQGLDCYGNDMDYVPIASLNAYSGLVESLLTTLSSIESNYLAYQTFLQNEKIAFNGYNDSITDATTSITNLTNLQNTLYTKITTTLPASINALNAQLAVQYQNLLNADQAFKQAVINQANGLSFTNFLSLMQNFVKVGSDAFELYETPSLSGAIDGIGDLINLNKEFAVQNIIPVNSDFTQITTAWDSIYNPNGNPEGNAKLAIQQSDLDTVLKPFLNLSQAANYVTQINDYVGIAQSINTKLLDYTNSVTQYNINAQQLIQKQAELKRIQAEEATVNIPGLIQYTGFLFNQYQDYLAYCLKYLYQENKAYEYMTCVSSPFNITDYSASGLLQFHANLKAGFVNQININGDPQQSLNAIPFSITNATNDPRSASFQSFLNTGTLSFQLNPTTDTMFNDWSTVMLTSYTVNFDCSESPQTQSQVIVKLTHAGDSIIYDTYNNPHHYSHDMILTQYTYFPDNSQPAGGGSFGGGTIGNNAYEIPLSPFATITIEVTTIPFDPQFLPNVTAINFTFSGYSTTPQGSSGNKQEG